jgi:hypothetical protein
VWVNVGRSGRGDGQVQLLVKGLGGRGVERGREIGMHDLISSDRYGKGDIGIVMDEFGGLLRVGE